MSNLILPIGSKNYYLAGPMSNLPYFNFPTFEKYAKAIEAKGHKVFSPARTDVERAGFDFSLLCPKGTHEELAETGVSEKINYKDCMKVDLNWIIDHADAIALLPGWEKSKGARCERALGECLGLEIIEL